MMVLSRRIGALGIVKEFTATVIDFGLFGPANSKKPKANFLRLQENLSPQRLR
jgi:hypothetical protein